MPFFFFFVKQSHCFYVHEYNICSVAVFDWKKKIYRRNLKNLHKQYDAVRLMSVTKTYKTTKVNKPIHRRRVELIQPLLSRHNRVFRSFQTHVIIFQFPTETDSDYSYIKQRTFSDCSHISDNATCITYIITYYTRRVTFCFYTLL